MSMISMNFADAAVTLLCLPRIQKPLFPHPGPIRLPMNEAFTSGSLCGQGERAQRHEVCVSKSVTDRGSGRLLRHVTTRSDT